MIPFTVNLRQTNYSLGIGNYKASACKVCIKDFIFQSLQIKKKKNDLIN